MYDRSFVQRTLLQQHVGLVSYTSRGEVRCHSINERRVHDEVRGAMTKPSHRYA